MPFRTRLTERLQLEHPVLSAPMGFVAGGALAAAVTRAGGLGLIGVGYEDALWLDEQFTQAGNEAVGCGFITWVLARQPDLLARALDRAPRAVMLSFGDPAPFAEPIRAAGAALLCQVQDLGHARRALDAGVDIIIAQGGEAGGHGARRGTLTLVPEVCDLCARQAPEVLVLAAGGIADGRGLAAALALGADGVLVGTRFYAAREALVHPALQQAVVDADGDATLRTTVVDLLRRRDWPAEFDIRVLRNAVVERWHGRERSLAAAGEQPVRDHAAAAAAGNAQEAGVIAGEAVGMIHEILPAATIIAGMVAEAEAQVTRAHGLIAPG